MEKPSLSVRLWLREAEWVERLGRNEDGWHTQRSRCDTVVIRKKSVALGGWNDVRQTLIQGVQGAAWAALSGRGAWGLELLQVPHGPKQKGSYLWESKSVGVRILESSPQTRWVAGFGEWLWVPPFDWEIFADTLRGPYLLPQAINKPVGEGPSSQTSSFLSKKCPKWFTKMF